MTRGICEFEGKSLHMDKPNIYFDKGISSLTSFIPGETTITSTYIVGTLVSNNSEKNYIFVNPQYLEN